MAQDPSTPPDNPDQILTLTDLARLFKLGSRKTALRALEGGELPVPVFYIRGQPRWTWAAVRRWIRGGHPGKPAQKRTKGEGG